MRLVLALVLACVACAPPAEPAPTDLSSIAWMVGEWRAHDGPDTTYESWAAERDHAMQGTNRTERAGQVVHREVLRIERTAGGVFYRAAPQGQPSARFRAVRLDATQAVFEDPTHDFPQRVSYRRVSAAEMIAAIDGLDQGKPRHAEWRFARTTAPKERTREATPSWDEPLHPALAQVRSLEDIRRHEGKLVEIHGRYEIKPVGIGKAPHMVLLVLRDGERVIRAYSPPADEIRFDGQQVVVVGTASMTRGLPGHIQQASGPHITSVDSLSLHPLVSPVYAEGGGIPTPPTLAGRADLARLRNHWVQVFATVEAVQPIAGDELWARVLLRLPDGTKLSLPRTPSSEWQGQPNQPISVIARLARTPATPPRAEGAVIVCPGRVERCGMDVRR